MIRWNEYRVKDIARQMGSGTTPSSKVERYYDREDYHWINSGDFNDSEVYGGKQMISELAVTESSALRFYMPDTVLVAMYGASIGKVGMLKVKATVNQACCAIVPNTKKVLPYFLFYLFINSKDALISKSFGGTQPNVSQGIIANMIFCVPSLSVQQKMVDYLDEKTSAIDARVELLEKKKDAYARLKKAMINRAVTHGLDEHVKLKDSGVEWIGMIPEHWEMKRIKDVVILRNEKAVDVSMPYIALENIVSWNANYVETDAETEGTNNIFKSGDILFGKLRPYLAKGYIPTYDGICSTEFFVMKPGNMVSNRFLLYYILSQRVIDFIKNKVAGVKMPRTNWNEFGSLSVNTPPFAEQQSIAAYLDEKCAKIDAAIANIDKQTDALKRLKRSLINEVISGKRMIE